MTIKTILKLLLCTCLYFLNCQVYANSYLVKPSGHYQVGFKDFHLINTQACPNIFYKKNSVDFSQKNPRHCNEVWLAIYYPTTYHGHSVYYPAPSIVEDLKSITHDLSKSKISEIKRLKSNTSKEAPIAAGHFPTIFFSPGYGVPTQEYENIIVNLVSHGYIVVGVNSQFINGTLILPNGHRVKTTLPKTSQQRHDLFVNSLKDLSFVYKKLQSMQMQSPVLAAIDWKHTGLLGHSLGAGTVAHFANHEGVGAVASLDLTIDLLRNNTCKVRIKPPFLHLFSSYMYSINPSGNFPYLCRTTPRSHNAIVVLTDAHSPNNKSYSKHMNFVDYSTLQYQPTIANGLKHLSTSQRFLGTGNGWVIVKKMNQVLLNFFNKHLKK